MDRYFAEDYIQRNPMLPSGSAPIKKFLSLAKDAGTSNTPPNETHRIIGEGDLVATHSTYYNFGPKPLVAFDVFRIENGLIAEHWDNFYKGKIFNRPDGPDVSRYEIKIRIFAKYTIRLVKFSTLTRFFSLPSS